MYCESEEVQNNARVQDLLAAERPVHDLLEHSCALLLFSPLRLPHASTALRGFGAVGDAGRLRRLLAVVVLCVQHIYTYFCVQRSDCIFSSSDDMRLRVHSIPVRP